MEIFQLSMTRVESQEFYQIEQFNELKTYLTDLCKKYKELVVTEDAITEAKVDRAYLNKRKKFINDERIRIEKMAIGLLKQQVKELTTVIDEAIDNIDSQVKTYENKAKQDKLAQINQLYEEIGNGLIPLESLFKEEWLNKGKKLSTIKEEIIQENEKFENNKIALKSLCNTTTEWEVALKALCETLDLPKALEKLGEFRMIAKLAKEDKPISEENADETKYTITFQINATKQQIEDLSAYLNANKYDFKQIKGE